MKNIEPLSFSEKIPKSLMQVIREKQSTANNTLSPFVGIKKNNNYVAYFDKFSEDVFNDIKNQEYRQPNGNIIEYPSEYYSLLQKAYIEGFQKGYDEFDGVINNELGLLKTSDSAIKQKIFDIAVKKEMKFTSPYGWDEKTKTSYLFIEQKNLFEFGNDYGIYFKAWDFIANNLSVFLEFLIKEKDELPSKEISSKKKLIDSHNDFALLCHYIDQNISTMNEEQVIQLARKHNIEVNSNVKHPLKPILDDYSTYQFTTNRCGANTPKKNSHMIKKFDRIIKYCESIPELKKFTPTIKQEKQELLENIKRDKDY